MTNESRLLGYCDRSTTLAIWHGSSDAEPDFVEDIFEPYLALWSGEEQAWAARLYESQSFRSVRERYIEISRLLDGLRPGPARSALVRAMHELERG